MDDDCGVLNDRGLVASVWTVSVLVNTDPVLFPSHITHTTYQIRKDDVAVQGLRKRGPDAVAVPCPVDATFDAAEASGIATPRLRDPSRR